jgi:hypothetical protein
VNLYDSQLRQALKSILPREPDIDSRPIRSDELFPEDLRRLVERARTTIDEKIKGSDQGHRDLQTRLESASARNSLM